MAADPLQAPRRRAIAMALGAASCVTLALLVAILALGGHGETALTARQLPAVAWIGAFSIALGLGGLYLWIERSLIRPIAALAAETRFIAEARPEAEIREAPYAILRPLPRAINDLARTLETLRHETSREIALATRRSEEQKARLEAVLRDLAEGVLACNLDHQVLLYNQVALGLLHVTGEIGLGRSLFNLITREPVHHALDRLRAPVADGDRPSGGMAIVCATIDARTLLSGRISLVRDADGQPTGYVLTLSDVTRHLAELGRRDALLRLASDSLRGPIANLRAAAETLGQFPRLAIEERRAFDQVILREAAQLSRQIETLDRDARGLTASTWPMADIHSLDLFNCVVRRLAETGGPTVTPVGVPLWMHGDSHALSLALDAILRRVARSSGTAGLDLEALLGDARVYVQASWNGPSIASATLDSWRAEKLAGAPGDASLGDVLARHNSEMWSSTRDGRAFLRIPLPAPARSPVEPPRRQVLPARPEFYDFDLFHAPTVGALGERPLRSLSFVVWDTETTGLKPSQGDAIVSIGAVRVVNGRILTGETFSRLVNPGRVIPQESARFHGITDEMVADAPPIAIVLPQFRAFVGDSVMVAHNAAFDLKFLRLKEAECGVSFDSPVLDTLLISAFLYREIEDHDLDAIARRLSIDIAGRHTALGDAMATAAVFQRMIDLLEARGMSTLDTLIDKTKMIYQIRARQAVF